MQLYASNGTISRSARRHARAHRPFEVVDLKSSTRRQVDVSTDRDDEARPKSLLTKLTLRRSGA